MRASPLDSLPHQPPALILGSAAIDEQGAVSFPLTPDCYYVDQEVLTAAGMVEAMAQAAALHQDSDDEQAGAVRTGVLVGLDDLEIRRFPAVGETIRIECRLERRIGPALWVEATISGNDRPAARGIVKIFLVPEEAA